MFAALSWAIAMVGKLDREAQARIADLLGRSHAVSHYSGMDCWLLVVHRMCTALGATLHIPAPQVLCKKMCECDSAAQSLLRTYRDVGEACIFKNIDDMFDVQTNWKIGILVPPAGSTVSDATAAWQSVGGIMDEFFDNRFDIERKAPCVRHDRSCFLYPDYTRSDCHDKSESAGSEQRTSGPSGRTAERNIGMAFGSTTCVDFSQVGGGRGMVGRSMRQFAAWKRERLKMHALGKEALVWHECVPRVSSRNHVRRFRRHTPCGQFVGRPATGWPVRRTRRFTILIDKARFNLKGEITLASLARDYGSSCNLSADDLLMAPSEVVVERIVAPP